MDPVWKKCGPGMDKGVDRIVLTVADQVLTGCCLTDCVSPVLCSIPPSRTWTSSPPWLPPLLSLRSSRTSTRSAPLHCDRSDFALRHVDRRSKPTTTPSLRSSRTSIAWQWDSSRVWPKQSTQSGGHTAGRTDRVTRWECTAGRTVGSPGVNTSVGGGRKGGEWWSWGQCSKPGHVWMRRL